jgi:hypothetical protein
MNWEYNGKMSNSLNSSLQESLFLEFVIILITLFCSLNILPLWEEFPQKISLILQYSIQTVVFMRSVHSSLTCRNYYICYCLCVGLRQLHLIPQVLYINNTTSHNNNSYSIHTNLTEDNMFRTELQRESEVRLLANMKFKCILLL